MDQKVVKDMENHIKTFINKMQERFDTDCVMVLVAPKGAGMVIGDHSGNPLMALSMAKEFGLANDRIHMEKAFASAIATLVEEIEEEGPESV